MHLVLYTSGCWGVWFCKLLFEHCPTYSMVARPAQGWYQLICTVRDHHFKLDSNSALFHGSGAQCTARSKGTHNASIARPRSLQQPLRPKSWRVRMRIARRTHDSRHQPCAASKTLTTASPETAGKSRRSVTVRGETWQRAHREKPCKLCGAANAHQSMQVVTATRIQSSLKRDADAGGPRRTHLERTSRRRLIALSQSAMSSDYVMSATVALSETEAGTETARLRFLFMVVPRCRGIALWNVKQGCQPGSGDMLDLS